MQKKTIQEYINEKGIQINKPRRFTRTKIAILKIPILKTKKPNKLSLIATITADEYVKIIFNLRKLFKIAFVAEILEIEESKVKSIMRKAQDIEFNNTRRR